MNLISCILFSFIVTFTPGPNNITAASMGMNVGYRETRGYLIGITLGFLLLMLFCSFLSKGILIYFPSIQPILKYVSATYILYLAWSVLISSVTIKKKALHFNFSKGVLLQFVNPKAIIFGLTIFGTFLGSRNDSVLFQIGYCILMGLFTFCAVSLWCLSGSFIAKKINRGNILRYINVFLAGMLAFTAVDLLDIIY